MLMFIVLMFALGIAFRCFKLWGFWKGLLATLLVYCCAIIFVAQVISVFYH
jgi:hypothetical protein